MSVFSVESESEIGKTSTVPATSKKSIAELESK